MDVVVLIMHVAYAVPRTFFTKALSRNIPGTITENWEIRELRGGYGTYETRLFPKVNARWISNTWMYHVVHVLTHLFLTWKMKADNMPVAAVSEQQQLLYRRQPWEKKVSMPVTKRESRVISLSLRLVAKVFLKENIEAAMHSSWILSLWEYGIYCRLIFKAAGR